MKKVIVVIMIAIVLLTACNSKIDSEAKQNVLVFNNEVIPEEMYQLLASNNIIHVGEYHNNAAHAQFLTQLVLELVTHNLLLIEMSHALEWIVEDYTLGKLEAMPAFMESFNQVDFKAIRAYNQNVNAQQKIIVKTIDINHSPQFLGVSVRAMVDLGYIEATESILEYLENHSDNAYVLKLQKHLKQEKESLVLKWGEKQFERLSNMVDREVDSIYCRSPLEEGDEALRATRRETVMKQNVEKIISTYDMPAIINTGFYHTQKKHVLGTDQEWLGEYLEFISPVAKENTYHLVVVPIEGAINWNDEGSKTRQSRLLDYSGSGEVFKTMLNISGGESVFLDFKASDFFMSEKLKMNFHYEIIESVPNQLFDGALLLK